MPAASRSLPYLTSPSAAPEAAGETAAASEPAAARAPSGPGGGVRPEELTEAQLLDRHARGDEAAFAELFRRFAGMVYNLTWRMSGDHEDARDLSQEVFFRIFRHLRGFAGRSSLTTWVYRVTINTCRSRLGRRRLPIDPWGEERAAATPDPAPSPERVALSRVAASRLEEALLRLPESFREAVVLRDVEGLAYEEIASVLDVPVGTVRSRIARGRAELRAALEGKR